MRSITWSLNLYDQETKLTNDYFEHCIIVRILFLNYIECFSVDTISLKRILFLNYIGYFYNNNFIIMTKDIISAHRVQIVFCEGYYFWITLDTFLWTLYYCEGHYFCIQDSDCVIIKDIISTYRVLTVLL